MPSLVSELQAKKETEGMFRKTLKKTERKKQIRKSGAREDYQDISDKFRKISYQHAKKVQVIKF